MANIKFTDPDSLEKYSFLWSEARLIIAAVALFLGGVPPLKALIPFDFVSGLIQSILTVCWIISGIVSVYLLYIWNQKGQTVFKGKDQKDLASLAVMIASGINLGLVGLTGNNIGMSLSSNRGVFIATGLIYLFAANNLYTKWNKNGQKLF